MLKTNLMNIALRQLRQYSKSVKRTKIINVKPKQVMRPNAVPLITCKRPEFNLYRDDNIQLDAKFMELPLASSGWQHYRSKHDYFIIHPHSDENTESLEHAKSFDKFNLYPDLLENLKQRCFIDRTTYIQNEAIPKILAGEHTLIAAETGCGKTIAYLLPIIQQILKRKRTANESPEAEFNSPQVLILTPGRELAIQIAQVAKELCNGLDLKVEVIVGGSSKSKIMHPKMKEIDILVGSMGVVSKMITTRIYRMHNVRHVVLDEADTMLDDSFLPQLGYVLKRFPFYKNLSTNHTDEVSTQLVLASATMPTNIQDLLQMVIDTNTITEVVSPNLHKILPHIQQKFIRMRKIERPMELLTLVKSELAKRRPIIVFGNKSATSDYISIFLNDNGVDAISLNGDHIRKIREGQFEKFQSGQVNVLATTDVASRGLDTKRACHVINYDFPWHIADYIHRCGRIGRVSSGTNCLVTNFVTGLNDVALVRKIEHTARTKGILPNVNANITGIITKKMIKEINQSPSDQNMLT